jgi:hypothetical protein
MEWDHGQLKAVVASSWNNSAQRGRVDDLRLLALGFGLGLVTPT